MNPKPIITESTKTQNGNQFKKISMDNNSSKEIMLIYTTDGCTELTTKLKLLTSLPMLSIKENGFHSIKHQPVRMDSAQYQLME